MGSAAGSKSGPVVADAGKRPLILRASCRHARGCPGSVTAATAQVRVRRQGNVRNLFRATEASDAAHPDQSERRAGRQSVRARSRFRRRSSERMPDAASTMQTAVESTDSPAASIQRAALQLTLQHNQFDSSEANGGGGSDTLVWELGSHTASVTVTGNILRNKSTIATVAMLECKAFNITGNVIDNAPTIEGRGSGLVVVPWHFTASAITHQITIHLFTVTGNTIFGKTNLGNFPREGLKLGSSQIDRSSAMLTWELFNTIV